MGKIPKSIWSVLGGGLRQIGGIAVDEYSRESSEHVLICPVCGGECSHITGTQKDDPRGWGSYGNVSVSIWGECGHRWTIFFNDHKGAVLVASHFNRVVSDWPPDDPDDEETDRGEADEPPRQREQDPADASEGGQMKIYDKTVQTTPSAFKTDEVVQIVRSEEFLGKARELSNYISALPLTKEENDKLVALMVEQVCMTEMGAFKEGVRAACDLIKNGGGALYV